MSDRLIVTVNGIPAPQGSKRFVGSSGGKGRMVESSKAVGPWREAVRHEVQAAIEAGGPTFPTGPVTVYLRFTLPRPKGHTGARGLRPSAPPEPAVRPDLDKLARAVLDGIVAGGAIGDDAQVVSLNAVKAYPNEHTAPGACIDIEAIER